MNYAFCLKFFFALALGGTMISNVEAEATSDMFEMLMNYTIDECKVRENASEEDVAAILSLEGDWPETREGKCFIDCFLEEVGLVRNFKTIREDQKSNFNFLSSKTTSLTSVDFSHLLLCCLSKQLMITVTR